MAKALNVDNAQKAFAEITAAFEDTALVASEGQAAPDIAAARLMCDRLIRLLGSCLGQAQHLRRRLDARNSRNRRL